MQLFKCFKWPKNFQEIFYIEKRHRGSGAGRTEAEQRKDECQLTKQMQEHEWEKPSWREEEECKYMANWPLAVCLGIYTARLQSTPQSFSPHDRTHFRATHALNIQTNEPSLSLHKHTCTHKHTPNPKDLSSYSSITSKSLQNWYKGNTIEFMHRERGREGNLWGSDFFGGDLAELLSPVWLKQM